MTKTSRPQGSEMTTFASWKQKYFPELEKEARLSALVGRPVDLATTLAEDSFRRVKHGGGSTSPTPQ